MGPYAISSASDSFRSSSLFGNRSYTEANEWLTYWNHKLHQKLKFLLKDGEQTVYLDETSRRAVVDGLFEDVDGAIHVFEF